MKVSKLYPYFYLAIAIILLTSCQTQEILGRSQLDDNGKTQSQLKVVVLDKTKIVRGQTIYVPIYSYIYHYNSRKQVINLSSTLSIRNTDFTNPIIITSVRYYDTNGKLVRQYLDKPVQLNSLASIDFFVEADDLTGGLGANFIVEWVAEKEVFEPLIEAVTVGTESSQGISFVSPGKVIKRFNK